MKKALPLVLLALAVFAVSLYVFRNPQTFGLKPCGCDDDKASTNGQGTKASEGVIAE